MGKVITLDTLSKKREDVRAEIEGTRTRLNDLLEELADIDAAEAYVRRYGVDDGKDEKPDVGARSDEARLPLEDGSPAKRMTKRQLFKTILEQAPTPWMTANEIQAKAKAITGTEHAMSSVSPMLSDMKKAGEIVRDDLKVALTSRIERESPVTDVTGP